MIDPPVPESPLPGEPRLAPDDLRHSFAHLAAGVCVLTTTDVVGRDVGLTVTSVTSVSLRPPLCLVCVRRDGFIHDAIAVADGWSITMLSSTQQKLADYTARHRYPSDTDDFSAFVTARNALTGTLVFPEALASVECRTHDLVPAGDHTVVLGEVVSARAGDGESPLVRLAGRYQSTHGLEADLRQPGDA
jgi:flavin reductase (DIM6/NTAB) family NADH-FMN oxidoreductase RutF